MLYAFQGRRRPALSAGFTFIELVVAVMILGILMGIAIPSYFYFRGWAAENATKTTLRLLKNSLEVYNVRQNRYPAKLEEMVGQQNILEKMPRDGWGKEYYYKPTPGGKHQYELYSYGSNGPELGTPEERISVWEV